MSEEKHERERHRSLAEQLASEAVTHMFDEITRADACPICTMVEVLELVAVNIVANRSADVSKDEVWDALFGEKEGALPALRENVMKQVALADSAIETHKETLTKGMVH